MEHTQECKTYFAKCQATVDEYNAKWPDHCTNCRGYGVFVTRYDPSPPGVALSPGWMYEEDLCPQCTGRESNDPLDIPSSRCPRCGQPGLVADTAEGPCRFCGWDYKDGGVPEMPDDCGCWDEEYERLAKELD